MTGVRTSAGRVAQMGRQLPAGSAEDEDDEGDEGRRRAVASWSVCESFGCGARESMAGQRAARRVWRGSVGAGRIRSVPRREG